MTLAVFPQDVITAAQASHRLYYPKGPFVSVSLAQWAVESAYGHDEPIDSDNPFGIKAAAGQPYVISMTHEVINGINEKLPQRFAKYASLTDAFNAHARLLATSPIYAAAQAAPTPDDYVRAMAPRYATAPNYAAVLLAVMKTQNLYRFDVPVQSQSIFRGVQSVTSPATSVPTISSPVTIDWGDLAAQLLAHETPIIESAASAGVTLALGAIPMGSFFSGFIGPTVTKQYVDQALTSLEDILKGNTLTVSPTEALTALAAKLFNQAEPALAGFLGNDVEPMIAGWVAKLHL